MTTRFKISAFRGLAALTIATAVVLPFATPASAQGLFEFLFGGRRHAAPPPEITTTTDPFAGMRRANERPGGALPYAPSSRETTGMRPDGSAPRRDYSQALRDFSPATGHCVRTCDGYHFPVHASGSLGTAQICRAFCPATETRVYAGGKIDYAVTADGTRYDDLDNAFLYREKLVDGCTCNGKNAFGLVTGNIEAQSDPSLRPGDIVATKSGLQAFAVSRNSTAEFTPVAQYPGFSKSSRDQLSGVKVSHTVPSPAAVSAAPGKPDKNGRAQASR